MVEIWQIISQDPQLAAPMLEHFMDLLQKLLPYEEKSDPREKGRFVRTATTVPLAVSFTIYLRRTNENGYLETFVSLDVLYVFVSVKDSCMFVCLYVFKIEL